MRRAVVAAALAAAAFGTSVPATAAGPGGMCDGTVDVACRTEPCEPGTPCTIRICLVWLKGSCATS